MKSQRLSPSDLAAPFSHLINPTKPNELQTKCFGPCFNTRHNIVVSSSLGAGEDLVALFAILADLYHQVDRKHIYYITSSPKETIKYLSDQLSEFNILVSDAHDGKNTSQIICLSVPTFDIMTRKAENLQYTSLVIVESLDYIGCPKGYILESTLCRLLNSPIRIVAFSNSRSAYIDFKKFMASPFELCFQPDENIATRIAFPACGPNSNSSDLNAEKALNNRTIATLRKFGNISDNSFRNLVYCPNKRICQVVAKAIADSFTNISTSNLKAASTSILDKNSSMVLKCGVGLLTPGISINDVNTILKLYNKKKIRILCSTPEYILEAEFTIVRGTYCSNYIGHIIPKTSNMIVLTDDSISSRLLNAIKCSTIVESQLRSYFLNFLNYLLASDTCQLEKIVLNSFLAISQKKDLSKLMQKGLLRLKENGFIDESMYSTELGEIAYQHNVSIETVHRMTVYSAPSSLKDVLIHICNSDNELKDILLRPSDSLKLKLLNEDPRMRFPYEDEIELSQQGEKAYILTIALLSIGKIEDWNFSGDYKKIKNILLSLLSCYTKIMISKKSYNGVYYSILITKLINTGMWENDSILLSSQIKGIGEVYAKRIYDHGVRTIADLRKMLPYQLESITGHRAGWGQPVIQEIGKFPIYSITVTKEESEYEFHLTNKGGFEETSNHSVDVIIGLKKDDILIDSVHFDKVIGDNEVYARFTLPPRALIFDLIINVIDSYRVGVDIEVDSSAIIDDDEDLFIDLITDAETNELSKADTITLSQVSPLPTQPEVQNRNISPIKNTVSYWEKFGFVQEDN